MNNLILLLALSLTDAIFAGYRTGAGRNPRIHKLDYTIVTCWAGLFAGLGAALLATLAGFAYVLTCGPFETDALAHLNAVAQPLVIAYALFATALLAVILFWTYPRRRTRELAVVLILGPCTLLRPYWIVGGALWAVWALADARLALTALIAFIAALQLGIEPVLNLWQGRSQRLRMRLLIAEDTLDASLRAERAARTRHA